MKAELPESQKLLSPQSIVTKQELLRQIFLTAFSLALAKHLVISAQEEAEVEGLQEEIPPYYLG
jgi:hypothetical protein